ncbi:hypothetical protein Tco_0273036 [Tanacetum coccineum]
MSLQASFLKDIRRQIMTTSDLVPRQKCSSNSREDRFVQKGWNFSSVLTLKNYFSSSTRSCWDNNNVKHRCIISRAVFIIHKTKFVEINHASSNKYEVATDPEMCMFALTVSIVEPKNIKEAMADSAWIEAMKRVMIRRKSCAPFARWKQFGFSLPRAHQSFYLSDGRENGFLMVTEGRRFSPEPGLKNFPTSDVKGFTIRTIDPFISDKIRGDPQSQKIEWEPIDQSDDRSKSGHSCTLTSSRPQIKCTQYASVMLSARPQLKAPSWRRDQGMLDTRKSTSRGIQFLGDKLVSWMSKKQNCTAMSSAEAEYVALSASCAQVMWMRTQLQDYGFNYNKIPVNHCNIMQTPVQPIREKAHPYSVSFIKETVEDGIIEL